MAHFVYTNAYLLLNGTSNVSADVEQLSFTHGQDLQDDTTMGDTFRNRLPGLQDAQLQVTFHDDFADNGLDEILAGLMGTTFAVAFRPVNTTISANNAEYQFTGVLGDMNIPMSIGETAKRTVSIQIASGTLVRDITP